MTRILYEQSHPIQGEEIVVGQMTPDYFILTMNRGFGDFPITLTKDHIERLAGMASCWGSAQNPYSQLIIAVKRLGSIKVWASHDETKHQDDTHFSPDSRSEP
jgi:hypothetical protein